MKRLTEQEYDARIAKFGRVVRVGKYVNKRTKTLHRCLIHGKEYNVPPHQCMRGYGLACCRKDKEGGSVKALKNCRKIRDARAKLEYDAKIFSLGRVIRLEEYINSKTKILHRCLIHGEEHYARPNCCLKGRGLACCKKFVKENLLTLLRDETRTQTYVYLSEIKNHPGYLKIGTSRNYSNRSRNGKYGKNLYRTVLDSKLKAFCIEQACLRDQRLTVQCPDILRQSRWPGYSEVLRSERADTVSVIQFYTSEMRKLGPYEFALKYLTPSPEEEGILREKLTPQA